MSPNQDISDLIDRLGQAALECRQLVSEVHGATKDLRAVLKEAKEAKAELEKAVHDTAEVDIRDEVRRQLEEMVDETSTMAHSLYDAIVENFDKLIQALMGKANTSKDIRPLIEQVASRASGQDLGGVLPRRIYSGPVAKHEDDVEVWTREKKE